MTVVKKNVLNSLKTPITKNELISALAITVYAAGLYTWGFYRGTKVAKR
jgi:hypothetical protein